MIFFEIIINECNIEIDFLLFLMILSEKDEEDSEDRLRTDKNTNVCADN